LQIEPRRREGREDLLGEEGGMMSQYLEAVGSDVVDCAIKVHQALGPGLLESAYQFCLAHELKKRNRQVFTEVTLPIVYDGQTLDAGYRIDMLVDDLVIVENKAVDAMLPIHEAQIITYLKLKNLHLGYLLNWNVKLMKYGTRRVVYNLQGPTPYPTQKS
jgi:GxxExxY protein